MYKEYTYTVLLFVYKPHPIVSFQLIPKAAPRSQIVEISKNVPEYILNVLVGTVVLFIVAVSRIRTGAKFAT